MQNPLTATRKVFGNQKVTTLTGLRSRIRFAPPLVIEETDLYNAINIIEQSLKDLDEVSLFHTTPSDFSMQFQLEFIPGDDPSSEEVPIMDK